MHNYAFAGFARSKNSRACDCVCDTGAVLQQLIRSPPHARVEKRLGRFTALPACVARPRKTARESCFEVLSFLPFSEAARRIGALVKITSNASHQCSHRNSQIAVHELANSRIFVSTVDCPTVQKTETSNEASG